MADGINHRGSGLGQTGDGAVPVVAQQGAPIAQKKFRKSAGVMKVDEEIEEMRKELSYLRRQVHGLRSKLHGELAVLALRIEDNDERSMRRRTVMRRWSVAAIVAMWLWQMPAPVAGMLGNSFLLPGLLLVCMTMIGGLAIVLLLLHNEADEEDHKDRYRNWFRLTMSEDA
jgi:hypothetical protein